MHLLFVHKKNLVRKETISVNRDRDSRWYQRRFKDATQIRLHTNISKDRGIETPHARTTRYGKTEIERTTERVAVERSPSFQCFKLVIPLYIVNTAVQAHCR